jgi:O-antigen/teichoic acid export membrane protein
MTVLLGLDFAIIRFLPEYLSIPDWHAASGYLRRSFSVLGRMSLSVFLVGLVLGVLFYLLDTTRIFTFEQHHPAMLFLWSIPFIALNTYFGKLLRSTQNVFLSLISLNIAQPVMLLASLWVLSWFGQQFNIHEALFAYILSTVLVLTGQLLISFARLPEKALHSEPRYETQKWSAVAIQLLITSFLTSNLNNLSVVISEIFDPNEANPGVLSAIFTICNSLWLAYSAVSTVVSPLISPAVHRKDKARLQMIITVGNLTMCAVGILLFLAIVFYGHAILGHFGKSFEEGYDALVVIALVFIFALANGMSLPILQYSGNQSKLIKLTIFGTIFVFVVGGALSHFYGLMGSAIAVCVVQIVTSIWSSYQIRKIFGVRPYIFF